MNVGVLFWSSSMEHYVYEHYIPGQELPFYVGKGYGYRAYQKGNRNRWWKNIVNKYGVIVKIVKDKVTEEQANKLEKELISKYGRRDLGTGVLVNMTDGGEGVRGIKRLPLTPEEVERRKVTATGKKHSEESKQKRSKKLKERMMTDEGKVHLEHLQRLGNSIEARKKKSESHKKFWATEEGKRIKQDAIKRGWETRYKNMSKGEYHDNPRAAR